MGFDSTHELLDSLLRGEHLTPDELDQVIAVLREDQFLDFKDGAQLNVPKQAAKVVRKYLSAFASADGGVLIIGVTEPDQGNRNVNGCKKPGQTELTVWATDAVSDLASWFSPPPRFQLVEHDDGDVLVCAVARAPALVPCFESGRTKYFLRIGHSTRECPEYLISDLVLGRRQHPTIDVRVAEVRVNGHDVLDGVSLLPLDVVLRIENKSLVPADNVRVGVVSWSPRGNGVNDVLEQFIEKRTPQQYSGGGSLPWQLGHRYGPTTGKIVSVEPFVADTQGVSRALLLPNYSSQDPVASAAVYVLPRGGQPNWFQLRFATTSEIKAGADNGHWNARKFARIHPSSRPVVHWERIADVDDEPKA